jgi:hypothetical protein
MIYSPFGTFNFPRHELRGKNTRAPNLFSGSFRNSVLFFERVVMHLMCY